MIKWDQFVSEFIDNFIDNINNTEHHNTNIAKKLGDSKNLK